MQVKIFIFCRSGIISDTLHDPSQNEPFGERANFICCLLHTTCYHVVKSYADCKKRILSKIFDESMKIEITLTNQSTCPSIFQDAPALQRRSVLYPTLKPVSSPFEQ